MKPTISEIKEAYARMGYVYFGGATPYNVNIWGIRKQTGNVDIFDDVLGITYMDDNDEEIILYHDATVDPGKYYLKNKLLNPKGTFILKPGQYRGCWCKGKHKGKYKALVQKPNYTGFLGWRDNLLDGIIQRKKKSNGEYYDDVTGLNMHRSGESYSAVVGAHSAGCQVRKINAEHKAIMNIIDKSLKFFGNSFTYTLFDEIEVFPELANTRSADGNLVKVKKWPDDYMNIE